MILKTFAYIIFFIAIFQLGFHEMPLALGDEYNYRDKPCFHLTISDSGEFLYVAFPEKNEIIEIDISTMNEIRSFNVFRPLHIIISPDDLTLFSDSNDITLWPNSEFIKLDINSGSTSSIIMNGIIKHFTIDDQGNWAWVIHRTYPIPNEVASETKAISNYPDSGYISKIDLSNFSLVNTVNTIIPLPMSVWYSDFSDKLFISTEISENPYKFDIEGTIILIMPGNLTPSEQCTVGGYHSFGDKPTVGTKWDDESSYYVVPNMNSLLPYSLRVFNTASTPIPIDYPIPDPSNEHLNLELKSIQKVEGTNFLWAIGHTGEPINALDRPKIAVKFNVLSNSYDIYDLPEVIAYMRYFAVSQDGRTLYIPLAKQTEGSIIVTSPGNKEPVCDLQIVTEMPYQGPSPAAIEFDASDTFDLDGDELTFHWDFDGDHIFDEPVDDAYTGDPDNPTHEYTEDYAGPVNLKVTDNYQGECEATVAIIVDIT